MRRLLGSLLLAGLLLPGAADAAAPGRLDVLAGRLRAAPLAVDLELSWLLDAPEQAALTRTLERSDVPVFVVVLPLSDADESGGSAALVATGLHRRLRKPGLYVVVDDRGTIDARGFAVPREDVRVPSDIAFPPRERPVSIPARVAALVERVDASPAGTFSDDDRFLSPLRPFDPPPTPSREPTTAGVATGFGVGGAAVGLLAGLWLRMRARGQRRAEEREAEAARRNAALAARRRRRAPAAPKAKRRFRGWRG